jgi:hypothetical protein
LLGGLHFVFKRLALLFQRFCLLTLFRDDKFFLIPL